MRSGSRPADGSGGAVFLPANGASGTEARGSAAAVCVNASVGEPGSGDDPEAVPCGDGAGRSAAPRRPRVGAGDLCAVGFRVVCNDRTAGLAAAAQHRAGYDRF